MQKMKTLTVGGETYRITDPEAARLGDGIVDESTAWSGKYIIDRLCPDFSVSGTVVRCHPMQGYPVTVTAPEATEVTRWGKNLFDKSAAAAQQTYTPSSGGQVTRWGYRVELPAGTYTLHAELAGTAGAFMFVYVNGADGSYKENFDLLKVTEKSVTLSAGDVIYIVNGASGGGETAAKKLFGAYNIQIELGGTVTPFVPYVVPEVFSPNDAILPFPGVNTLWADAGSLTVTGKADPIAVIAGLEERLAALEAALINT